MQRPLVSSNALSRILSGVVFAAVLGGLSLAEAGDRAPPGPHTATTTSGGTPSGPFQVTSDQEHLIWTDGNLYTRVPTDPPPSCYYLFDGYPDLILTFHTSTNQFEHTLGAGTYQ